jgi:hypothetical protein
MTEKPYWCHCGFDQQAFALGQCASCDCDRPNEMASPIDLEALRKLIERAFAQQPHTHESEADLRRCRLCHEQQNAQAELHVQAPSVFPALIDEIEQLRQHVEQMETAEMERRRAAIKAGMEARNEH